MAETENVKAQWPSLSSIQNYIKADSPKILSQINAEIKQIESTLAQVVERRNKIREERIAAEQLRREQERLALAQEEALKQERATPLFEPPEDVSPSEGVVSEPLPSKENSVDETARPAFADQPKIDVAVVLEPTSVPSSALEKEVEPQKDVSIETTEIIQTPTIERIRPRPSMEDKNAVKPDDNRNRVNGERRNRNRNDRNRQDYTSGTAGNESRSQEAALRNNQVFNPVNNKSSISQQSKQAVAEQNERLAVNRIKQFSEALNANMFQPTKKPTIDKPVIKIYVPPAEEKRPVYNKPTEKYSSGQRPSTGYAQNNQNRFGNNNSNFNYGRNQNNRNTPSVMELAKQHSQIKQLASALSKPPISNATGKAVKKKTDVKGAPFDGKRAMDKKTLSKKGYITTSTAFDYDELGQIKKIRARKSTDKKRNIFIQPSTSVINHAILNKDTITIKELSEKIGKTGSEIIRQLFLLNIIKTINDVVDFETAELIAVELGVTLELQRAETVEERAIAYHDDDPGDVTITDSRPPVVTIMGHVDHGKTSILDYIRKENVAGGEAGGITQHIGAYSVVVDGSKITFLDTPGHAAFTAMRARGANVTDIVIIVIAGDDGIMPQTIEAINHAKAAQVSIIVALNKMDKAGVDIDKIYSQLSDHDLLPEDWGGKTPVIKMSAKTGEGIPELLETILTIAEITDYRANADRKAKGTIIEARLDKGKGPMATVLVQNGTLNISDYVVAGVVTGKIRAMIDSFGRNVLKATPSTAVSILGLSGVPEAGDQLLVVESEKMMRQIADTRTSREQEKRINTTKGVSLDDVFKGLADGKLKNLNLIIKADVQGSVEAIKDTLVKLSNDEIKVAVVHAVAGAINESDVMLADTTGSIIIGFNVRPDSNAKALAERNSIDIRLYRIIYDAIDDVKMAIKGLSAPKYREIYLGKAEVRETFKITGVGVIAGCMVKDGKIVRNAKVRLIRDNIVIADTHISSLKRMKDDAKEVATGFECGIGLDNFNDIKVGDIIESFNLVQDMEA
ncbi:MAG: translation initiation factor IF-2 [Christensenellaceae bacterium]|jgi:translation initiation factor IF-2|nr:translation initiation factor IF-2 [Christensenellaceae bacterium]